MHPENRFATAILNFTAPEVIRLVDSIARQESDPRRRVQHAHAQLDGLNAVYSINDAQSAARTLRFNRGSCAQRMACLEAIARGTGVPTRVRGLLLHRSFWFHRLPLLRPLLPPTTLMPWPQFLFEGVWTDFDELFAPMSELAARAKHPFTNAGASLFSAVRDQPVDLLGKMRGSRFDLSRFVVRDEGFFDTRDELMRRFEDRQPGFLGRLIFDLVYGGRPIRRQPE